MDAAFQTHLLNKGIPQRYIDELSFRGIVNNEILMFTSISDFSSMLNLCTAAAVCVFNKIREYPFQLPPVVREMLMSANIQNNEWVYFRRLEITTITQLNDVTVEDMFRIACPVLAAHRLKEVLVAYFKKRKRTI